MAANNKDILSNVKISLNPTNTALNKKINAPVPDFNQSFAKSSLLANAMLQTKNQESALDNNLKQADVAPTSRGNSVRAQFKKREQTSAFNNYVDNPGQTKLCSADSFFGSS